MRANNVSIVNIERALAGNPDAEVARIPLVRPDGQPSRPRGSAITSDGRYAVISGGPSSPPFSQELGHLYVIDLRSRKVVATVTGVGHEPYALAVVQKIGILLFQNIQSSQLTTVTKRPKMSRRTQRRLDQRSWEEAEAWEAAVYWPW